MHSIANILWFVLGGFIIAIFYLFGSLVLMITIVGIPFGLQTLKLTELAAMPFGRDLVTGENASGCLYLAMNIIWILVAGLELALLHVTLALICTITIIGIPFAKQHIKLASMALVPFGSKIKEVKKVG